ncbi:hypothetical protein BDQ17DRAFT_1344925 [Cyathus striatus]|nr:hypothetical protein BDQ17DRAFT_1344925 [Cyathus striatus]
MKYKRFIFSTACLDATIHYTTSFQVYIDLPPTHFPIFPSSSNTFIMAPTSTQHAASSSYSTSSSSSLRFWHTPLIFGLELWKYLVIVFACFAVFLLACYILWIRPFTRKAGRESLQDLIPTEKLSPTAKKCSPASSQLWRLLSPKSWKSSPPFTTPSPSSSFGCKDALAVTRFHLNYPDAVYDPLKSPAGLFTFPPSSLQANIHPCCSASPSILLNSSTSHLLQYSATEVSLSRCELDIAPTHISLSLQPGVDSFGIPILPLSDEVPGCAGHGLWNNSKLSPICGSAVSMPSTSNSASPLASEPPVMDSSVLASSRSILSPTRCRFPVSPLPSSGPLSSFSLASLPNVQNKPLPLIPMTTSP